MSEEELPCIVWSGRAGGSRAAHSDVADPAGQEFRIVLTEGGRYLTEKREGADSMGAPRWNVAAPGDCWPIIDALVAELLLARRIRQDDHAPTFATTRPEADTMPAEASAEA